MVNFERNNKNSNEDSNEDSNEEQELKNDIISNPKLSNISTQFLTQNTVRSLCLIKNSCLLLLDLVLLKTVHQKGKRRLSNPIHATLPIDLLNSVNENKRRFSLNFTHSTHLTLDQKDESYYTLSYSLATLLNDIYRLFELNSTFTPSLPIYHNDLSIVQQQLYQELLDFQLESHSIDSLNSPTGAIILWKEINNLILMLSKSLQPPAYEDLPIYQNDNPTLVDLDILLNTIDRLFVSDPILDQQRVDQDKLNLERSIDRLSKGRLDNQRASPITKNELLQDLIQNIQKAASKSFDNQRVQLSIQQQKKLDFAFLKHSVIRLNKGRYNNQDWCSDEETIIHDISHMVDLLVKSLDRPGYDNQRYVMSDSKQRKLFMYHLFNKVESLEGHRLVNQDAEVNEDLKNVLYRIHKNFSPK